MRVCEQHYRERDVSEEATFAEQLRATRATPQKTPWERLKEVSILDAKSNLSKDPLSVLDSSDLFEEGQVLGTLPHLAEVESWLDAVDCRNMTPAEYVHALCWPTLDQILRQCLEHTATLGGYDEVVQLYYDFL
ncbi:hypothetical protein CYMTET_52446 [Cymbomonas tetramitiformis]|uniref:Uncharacterized protein n=1 Tax=Cymbomonas tetramitiformis TaxID=36881 RepID=A0AAE0BJ90_9CHLO|nr:hypothetical protein CYMTET_52446 [Cymbomonas tetramitiformis]